ncbi:ligand-binding sensor domain-containing protein [Botryobacter ruber]|uniref:ligand-binding sensor domain-containing protein n=1 Tax=Botryobacter ruber TaxID=2171629 RepID=UPI000E0A50CC|nr:two-component regulator propeller domain-containing protein [Botryobacter ruber]
MKKFLLIFSFLLIQFLAVAQVKNEGIPSIRNYTHKDYKAASQNWAIVQDHRGVLYFGNNAGILEFDGNLWNTISLDNRTNVRSLAIDNKGRIYVGGQDDFGYLEPDAQGQLVFKSLKGKIEKQYQNFDDVWKIYTTSDGVYFCTVSGIYFLQDNQVKVYKVPAQKSEMAFFVQDKLYVPVMGKGIYELKQEKMVLIPNSSAFGQSVITAMLPAAENKVLLVTEQEGLFTYDGYTHFEPWATGVKSFLAKAKAGTAIALAEGYAIGTSQDGLLLIDNKGQPLQHLNRDKGLQNNTVRSIYQDNAGNLWLGLNNGIDYVEINSPFTLFNIKNGLPGTAYTSLMDKDRLYLGTSDGLYYRKWSNRQNPLETTGFRQIENSQGQVYNLQKIAGHLLLSHHNGAYELVDDRAVKLSDHRGAWLFMPLKDYPGYLVCGTYSGLYLYKLVGGQVQFQWKIAGFNESSRVMEEDEAGNLWVAHGYKGVYKLKLEPDLKKVQRVDFYNEKNGFPSNLFINTFKIGGKLVFTGERGVFKFNEGSERFEQHEELGKLFDENVHVRKLVEDQNGNIWFSAGEEMGILKKQPNGSYEVEKNTFSKMSGKLVGGFEHIAYYDRANVLFGTDEGFVHYHPSFLQTKNVDHKFYTLIRKIEARADGKDTLVFAGAFSASGYLSVQQPEERIPELPYRFNSLKFTYGAISYSDIDGMAYQVFLEGHDKNWSSWSPVLQKEYTNLGEGDYTFHVRARDIYNNESAEASFRFEVAPPWYRSLGAYAVYVFLGIVLLFLLKKRVDRQIYKTKLKLEKEQQKALLLQEAQHMEEVLKAEKEIIRLNNEKLENELNMKNKELASSALHVIHSLDTVEKVRNQLQLVIENVNDRESQHHLRKVLRSVEDEIKVENNWDQFELHFNQIHEDFLKRLRVDYPELTHRDIKLCAYLRMSLSSKEIASLLNLSIRGVETSRYRIRKKMNLEQEVNLTEFILKY